MPPWDSSSPELRRLRCGTARTMTAGVALRRGRAGAGCIVCDGGGVDSKGRGEGAVEWFAAAAPVGVLATEAPPDADPEPGDPARAAAAAATATAAKFRAGGASAVTTDGAMPSAPNTPMPL
jgi:hypothetical protein